MRRSLIISLVPLLIGMAIRILLARGWVANPILFLRADAGTLALLLGIFLSITVGIGISLRTREDRVRDGVVAAAQREAVADRRRFLQRLDHELKNPLTAMRAGLANLDGAGPANPEALESVKVQTLRLSRLVADLRKIAELEQRPIEAAPVKIDAVLKEAIEHTRDQPAMADRSLTLSLPQAPWPLPTVPGDEDLIFLAIHNLLNNALKFSQPEDTIEVRAFEDGSMVVIEVADTGPGIPEEEVPHVWQELYRGKGARSIPGSGLGLALVRAIIERHGGEVDLRSRVGQGTVVSLRVPAGDVTDL